MNMLSKDLPNTGDDMLGEDLLDPSANASVESDDILGDDTLATPAEEAKPEEPAGEGEEKPEGPAATDEPAAGGDDVLGDILKDAEDNAETAGDIKDSTDEAIQKVDDVQEAVKDGDMDEAIKLLDEMNTALISAKADAGKYETESTIFREKLETANRELADMKATGGESNPIDDKDLAQLNRMYTDAIDGNEGAKKKTTKTLEDMYYKLTGETFEDKEVAGANAGATTDGALGEFLTPDTKQPASTEDKFDIGSDLEPDDMLG